MKNINVYVTLMLISSFTATFAGPAFSTQKNSFQLKRIHEEEMSATGLSLTLAIANAMPAMDDDVIHQKLGAYYEEYISLGYESIRDKNKFIHNSKEFIIDLQTNPSMLAALEEQEK